MIKINKKVSAFVLAGGIALSHIPHVNAEMRTEGDKIKAVKTVNVRCDNNLGGERIDSLPKGQDAQRILSCDNGWSLIRYNKKIGFVKDEFIEDISDENIYSNLDFTEMRKILMTKENVYLRLDPFIDADAITTIPENTKIEILAYSSNEWYLVNYNGKLGFIHENYVKDIEGKFLDVVRAKSEVNLRSKPSIKSEKYNIMYAGDELPYLEDYNDEWYKVDYFGRDAYVIKRLTTHEEYKPIDFMKVVYIKNGTPLLSYASDYAEPITFLDKYETGEVLTDEGNFYFIRTLDYEGYIRKDAVSDLKGLFVIIDISSQKLIIYENNDYLLKTNIVSGKDETPTPIGKYKIEAKRENYTLRGEDYEVDVAYWLQIKNNYGAHDLNMNGDYGGDIFHKRGSHGCVRMHIIPAEKVYHLVKTGTPVIIHK